MNNSDKSLINRYIPITDWLSDYSVDLFKDDLRAGLTVGILLIPQSMAYALLAGLPPIYGLYTSIIPLVIYAFFGTSHQLAVGPVAKVSILVITGVGALANPGSNHFIQLVLVTCFLAGLLQFLMGIFHLGFLMNFVSTTVFSGFTSAAALIIGFSQLGNLFGLQLVHSNKIYRVGADLISKISQIHWLTVSIGIGCILFLIIIKKWKSHWPAELIVSVLGIVIVWYFQLDQAGVAIVGSVSRGIPVPALPKFSGLSFWDVLPSALAIALLSFTQSIALAQSMVRRHKNYKLDSNQELFSIGLANMVGSIFHGFPVAGSFSRTAVNDENGAQTAISQLISASMIVFTLFLLTPLIYYLPLAVLAAIIITAIPRFIEIGEAKFLWRVRKREFALMMITFFATLGLGLLEGIGIGVLISLGIVIYRSSYPNIVMLGRLPNTDHYRDLERHPEGLTQTNTIIVRVDASLYFANISYMKEKLEELEIQSGKDLDQVIIDAIGINEVDPNALHVLKELVDEYKERDIDVLFTGLKGPVRDIFKRSGLEEVVGPDRFYLNINRAVESLEKEKEEASHLV
ncbi:MAG TPA: solute carrier family 26 protein [Balneolaceae bacterium]|nr:solute carrier family 26 protein [Balneolaceae bacterium]